MKKVKISAPTKEQLQEGINKYFYSSGYIINENNQVYNTLTNKFLDYHYQIRVSRGRYQLVYDSSDKYNLPFDKEVQEGLDSLNIRGDK